MKLIFRFILVYGAALLCQYLCAAFTKMQFDITQWTESQRGIMMVMGLVAVCLSCLMSERMRDYLSGEDDDDIDDERAF